MGKRTIFTAVTIVVLAAAMIGGATMAWFTDSDTSEPVTFTAGTLLIEAGSSSIGSQYFDPNEAIYLYGVEAGTGDLYEINVKEGVDDNARLNKIYEGLGNKGGSYPNALAFDNVNDRLYFISTTNGTQLKFFDFNDGTVKTAARSIQSRGAMMCAAFGDGYYWFIPEGGSHGSGKTLFRWKIDPATGEVVSGSIEEVATLDATGNFNYGDIAIDYVDGIIYGSASTKVSGKAKPKFFSYNIATKEFEEFEDAGLEGKHLQLAYGSDRILYGHSGDQAGTGDWYKVTFADDGKVYTSDSLFNTINLVDLASGYRSVWNPGDTAQARLSVKNVGTKKSHVRLALGGSWTAYDEEQEQWVPWTPETTDNVTITINGSQWVAEGGRYYYKEILAPEDIAVANISVHLDGPKTGNEFQGKRFVLTGSFDAIQTTNGASAASWGMVFDADSGSWSAAN